MSEENKHQRYGRCVVERVIGRGARSTVYLAWHEAFQIPVAVKVMDKKSEQEGEQFSSRFLREARIAAQLTHPNIVRVYDCGETEESFYLVLEYIEGESCRDKLEQWGAFDWQRAAQIIKQVADGLEYASKKGIIHRDLKPENIMIDSDGNVRIADLGLAKEVIPGRSSATADGDVLGTPYYMSPEQIRQPSQVDFRSDIYSLGATLYHLATGEVPFEAPTPFEIMTKHLNDRLPSPLDRRPDLPEALCDVIVRAMAKEPGDRYQSYGELVQDLDELLQTEPQAETSIMGDVEDAVREAAAEEPDEPKERKKPAPRPRPRPIRPVELPMGPLEVTAKTLGILAVTGYAFLFVCLYHFVLTVAGLPAAIATTAGGILLSAAAGYLRLRCGLRGDDGEVPHPMQEELSAALGRLSERLNLPVPRLCINRRKACVWSSYAFFSRRGTVHLPGGWLEQMDLSEKETEALLAQALCGMYAGDADLRTLLAVPRGLLAVARAITGLLSRIAPPGKPGARLALARACQLGLVVLLCAAIAYLFFISVWAGALGLLFLAILLFTAGFERQSRYAADSFAAEAAESKGAVETLIALHALSSAESYPFLRESMGKEPPVGLLEAPPSAVRHHEVILNTLEYYAEAEHVPDTLELAGSLFSLHPLCAERLNRLAGVPRRPRRLATAAAWVRRLYARLAGTNPQEATTMAELGGVGRYAATGAVGGVLAVALLGFLYLRTGMHYPSFLVAVGALAAATGLVIAPQVCREGLSAGRLGWACVVASISFVCTAMVGFCLFGGAMFSRFALQFPVAFFVVLFLGAAVAAIYARLGSALGIEQRGAPPGVGSKTAHTVLMPVAGGEGAEAAVPTEQEQEPASPAETGEMADRA